MEPKKVSWPMLLAGGLLAASLFGLFESGGIKIQLQSPHPSPARADNVEQIHQEVGTFAKMARRLKPAVVNIAVEKTVTPHNRQDQLLRQFFPNMEPPTQQAPSKTHGQGSGVIISSDGYIVTNNHVVSNADEVRVTLNDGKEYVAHVIGTDPQTDIALVKVNAPGSLPTAEFGDSDRLEVGDWVMAIGNPFGLDATVTVGVLSAKGRFIGAGMYDDFLQTDASINPGNSGGPLLNTDGQIVGINTAIIPNGQGIGFSIPANLVKSIIVQLKDKGRVIRGFLGLGIQPLTGRLKQALSLPGELHGALVSKILPDGPGARSGAQLEDVITEINGRPVVNDRDLLSQVAITPIGSTATLTVLRNGHQQDLKVLITERPDDDASRPVTKAPGAPSPGLGLEVEPITPAVARQLATRNTRGVVIVNVTQNSPADKAGLRQGDIVRKVGRTNVSGTQDFLSAIGRGRDNPATALLVERAGNAVFIVLDSGT
jgi:serine protease Do